MNAASRASGEREVLIPAPQIERLFRGNLASPGIGPAPLGVLPRNWREPLAGTALRGGEAHA